MILGIGNDLVDIRRIERMLDRFGPRFVNRVFTAEEQERAARYTDPQAKACCLAKRFAAKEACAKALGTGFAEGVAWSDLGVTALPSGRPTMAVTGGARAVLDRMVPAGMAARVDVSLTDEYPMAQAMVIISAVPEVRASPKDA